MGKEWYNLDKLNSVASDALIAFIVGARRIGKTTHLMKLACDTWYENRNQTMWLRNKKVELQDPAFTQGFLNTAKREGWCDESWVTYPDGVYTDKTKEEQVILFQSISTASNRRGNATPDVKYMVFDEFMPEDRKYPPRAHIMLMSLTKTVLSGREDARCYCLSNFISAANPYWAGFQIYPKRELDVTYFPEKRIAIEVCRNYKSAIEEDNPWNLVYQAGGYQDYASELEDSLFSLVKKTPRGGRYWDIYLLADGQTYGCMFHRGLLHWHQCKPTPGARVFATTLQETSNKVSIVPNYVKQVLKQANEDNILRFNSPNTMYVILSLIYDAV